MRDGYLWFHGRQKQIIIHDGSNICPQEVEAALLEHAAVASAGVVGVRSPCTAKTSGPMSVWRPGAPPPTMQDLIRFARARVGYKAPEEIVVLGAMPLNATGKVDRVTLKRWRRSGAWRSPRTLAAEPPPSAQSIALKVPPVRAVMVLRTRSQLGVSAASSQAFDCGISGNSSS